MFDMFHAWQEQAAKLEQGEITKEEYDQWRYKYPELDTSQHWAKVPSQAVSNMLMEELAKIEHVLNIEELYPGTFRIRFDDDENITERVVALSIQNGWRLKEITMERCSLDIIFAQLSGKLKNNI